MRTTSRCLTVLVSVSMVAVLFPSLGGPGASLDPLAWLGASPGGIAPQGLIGDLLGGVAATPGLSGPGATTPGARTPGDEPSGTPALGGSGTPGASGGPGDSPSGGPGTPSPTGAGGASSSVGPSDGGPSPTVGTGGGSAPTATPRPRGTLKPTPPPLKLGPVNLPPASHGYLLITAGDLMRRPTSGAAWNNLKAAADAPAGTPDISNQDDDTDQHVFAKALVFARTGIASYRDQVVTILQEAIGTETPGRTLALGRNMTGYVFAADLISLSSADPSWDTSVFRPWLRKVLTESMTEGVNLVSTARTRPNNWGTYAGASWAAIAAYLGDASQLSQAATVFRGWLGDRSAYAGFKFEAVADTWSPNPSQIVGIDPSGSAIAGHSVDGVLPSDMSRGGSFRWPPGQTGYVWEGLAGAYEEAEILARQGYATYTWSDDALGRAVGYLWQLNSQVGYWFDYGDSALHANSWIPWLANARYGTNYPVRTTWIGRGMGFTDWLYP